MQKVVGSSPIIRFTRLPSSKRFLGSVTASATRALRKPPSMQTRLVPVVP